MTEENKAPQDAEQVETPEVDTPDEQPAEPTEPEQTPEGDEDSEQVKAQLEKEREARKKAEKAAADRAFKLREQKRNQQPEPEEEGKKYLTREEAEEIVAREREKTRKEMLSDQIKGIADRLATNDTERDLIIETHRNRSFPEHLSLEQQLEECFVIANKSKILGENRELKRAVAGKQSVSTDAAETRQDEPKGKQPNISGADKAEFARLGFKWNGTNKRWEKKLPNGDTLVRQNGRNQLIPA